VVDVIDDHDDEFGISFPPNARLASVEFTPTDLRVLLEDGGSERIVPASDISALHGASIRREIMLPDLTKRTSFLDKVVQKETVEVQEAIQYVIALRASTIGELWYLVADTFNFRKALGAETGLVLDANLKLLVRKLASFAPRAVQDAFIAAMLAGSPLPPPITNIMEFFRTASR
jgi:hypothetical protein